MSRNVFLLATLSIIVMLFYITTRGQNAAAPTGAITRAELPGLMKEALMNDPGMIMDAVKKLHEKQTADSQKEGKEGAGNPKGDVTVVEFFDYHCGYCKHLYPAIAQLLKEDKNVRVVFREFPILSDDSVNAARAALAANAIDKDKYFAFHTALMQTSGKFDDATLADIAKKQGIDAQTLKNGMAKKDVTAELDKNRALAEDLGIRGTPAILIGDQMIPGAISYDELKKMVDDTRSGKKSKS